MSNPKMFSKSFKSIPNQPVFVIKHKYTGERFECSMTPKHYQCREAAEYTIDFMQIPEYEVQETEYNPNEDIYE